MPGENATTVDHDTIRAWVESRGGKPSTVKGTEAKGEQVGILRIHFPGFGDEESFKEISWDDFFAKFEEQKLAFLYQEQTASGDTSRFFKFIKRK